MLALRLREKYPLGSSADVLAQAVKDQGFILFSPCPNDENVEGGKYLSPDWSHPDAFVYWRRDARDRLIFLDGHTAKPTR